MVSQISYTETAERRLGKFVHDFPVSSSYIKWIDKVIYRNVNSQIQSFVPAHEASDVRKIKISAEIKSHIPRINLGYAQRRRSYRNIRIYFRSPFIQIFQNVASVEVL